MKRNFTFRHRLVFGLAFLVLVSFFMGFVQWLASESGGYQTGEALSALGHPVAGNILTSVSTFPGVRGLDYLWQFWVNAPRNWLFARFGFRAWPRWGGSSDSIESLGYMTKIWEQGHPPSVRYILKQAIALCAGTVVLYTPLILLIVTWRQRKMQVAAA